MQQFWFLYCRLKGYIINSFGLMHAHNYSYSWMLTQIQAFGVWTSGYRYECHPKNFLLLLYNHLSCAVINWHKFSGVSAFILTSWSAAQPVTWQRRKNWVETFGCALWMATRMAKAIKLSNKVLSNSSH